LKEAIQMIKDMTVIMLRNQISKGMNKI